MTTEDSGTVGRHAWSGLFRMWSSAPSAERMRKPTDVMLLAVAVIVCLALGAFAPEPTATGEALLALIASASPVITWFWSLIDAAMVIWALLLLLVALVSRHRQRLAGELVLAAALGVLAAIGVSWLGGTDPGTVWSSVLSSGPPATFVDGRVAGLTAVIVTASPHMSRPWRYVGRVVILLGALAAIGLGSTPTIGAAAAIGAGVAAAAVVHLVFGSPQGRLTELQVKAALMDLGVTASEVVPAEVPVPGEDLYIAATADGRRLVKIYGRDSWDTQFVGSIWTSLTRRGEAPRFGGSRRSRVEHEALLTLMAAREGVPVFDISAVGIAGHGDAVLVTEAPVQALIDLDPGAVTDLQLDGLWRATLALHGAGITHGRIDRRRIALRGDGVLALGDLGSAELGADEGSMRTERARVLVAAALVVGHDRAIASALRVLGADGLEDVLPYLQPAALGREARTALKESDWSLEDLRTATVTATGVEEPPLEQLQRVTPRSVVTVLIIALMIYIVISSFANVDLASVAEALQDADWAWMLAALLMSPVIQMSFAFSTIGATTAKLRYFPVLMLQYAIQFIALVLPATAARLALEVRFFERFGIKAGPAVSMGMIDSFSGFLVQIALILTILISGLPGFTSNVFSSNDTSSSTSTSSSSTPSLIGLMVALAVVGLVVSLVVPKLRHQFFGAIPRIVKTIREQVKASRSSLEVLKRPRKIATMLLGNLGAQMLQAAVLGLCLYAFGETAHFSQLILINTAVSLFAGLMPVPGGMGVAEAGYTAGLQAVGVPSAIALSTAIAFRLVTFYLPPLWGSAAMRWLRREEYV